MNAKKVLTLVLLLGTMMSCVNNTIEPKPKTFSEAPPEPVKENTGSTNPPK